MCSRYQGDSLIRPEWSKGWGYTSTKAWDNTSYFEQEIPRVHAKGQPESLTIQAATKVLKKYDPKALFTSPLLDRLLK